VPAPGEAVAGPEFQTDLGIFERGLREHGFRFSQNWFAQDAVGGHGYGTGLFAFVLATLGPKAIAELRKLLEAIVVRGREVELTNGRVKVRGSARELQKLLTPEQIGKLLEPPPTTAKKRISHGGK